MADTKITALTALTAADPSTDVLPIVDTSDTTMAASGTTKKISINNILGASGTATLASATISGDLTVDTSTLKVDSANNRVGIKQASPSHPFQIGTTDLILDATSNVGIGVVPSAWSNSGNIDLPNVFMGISSSGTYGGAIANNAYYNAGWKYKAANYANLYLTGAGEHKWLNAPVGAAAGDPITTFGTAKMTLDASGRLLVGPTSANTSGGVLQLSSGITFPATQVASSDANTLDDYEESSWSPTIVAASGTPTTVTVNSATYTKIGRLVVCSFDFSIVNIGTASSSLQFSLPFASATSASFCGAFREKATTGSMGQVFYNSATDASCLLYNNNTVWVNGYRISGNYTYFAA